MPDYVFTKKDILLPVLPLEFNDFEEVRDTLFDFQRSIDELLSSARKPLDEDDLASDDAERVVSEQAIKAYVDAIGVSGMVEDAAYGAGWNADTSHAPSQNAVYDILNTTITDLDGFPDRLKNLAATEIAELEAIGTTTISAAQWGYLGNLDQDLITTSSVKFDNIYAGKRPVADVMHYGAVADGGPGQTNTDNQVAFQDANNALTNGGIILVPDGKYYLGSQVTLSAAVTLQGIGWEVNQDNEDASAVDGSWIYIEDTGFIPILMSGKGSAMRDMGMYWDQPTAAASWTPTAYDYAIEVSTDDVYIQNVCLLNPTKGIHNSLGGRLQIDRLYGQPFTEGIVFTSVLDSVRVTNVHFWPFWSDDSRVTDYTSANGTAIKCLRLDNPNFSNIFCLFYKYGMHFTTGPTSVFHIVNLDCDHCKEAVYIDAANTTGQFVNFTAGSYSGAATSIFRINAGGCIIQLLNARISEADKSAIDVDGNNTTLLLDNFYANNWGVAGGGEACIDIGTNATVKLGPLTVLTSTGSTTKYAGAGTFIGWDDSLASGFSIMHGATAKKLTVEDTSLINQDLTTDASPTFAGTTINGNITVTGNVDGRDISADLDQAVKISSSPTFAKVTTTGGADLVGNNIKLGYAASGDVLDTGVNDTYLKARNEGSIHLQIPSGTGVFTVATSSGNATLKGTLNITGLAGADPAGHKAVYYNTTTKSLFYDNT